MTDPTLTITYPARYVSPLRGVIDGEDEVTVPLWCVIEALRGDPDAAQAVIAGLTTEVL